MPPPSAGTHTPTKVVGLDYKSLTDSELESPLPPCAPVCQWPLRLELFITSIHPFQRGASLELHPGLDPPASHLPYPHPLKTAPLLFVLGNLMLFWVTLLGREWCNDFKQPEESPAESIWNHLDEQDWRDMMLKRCGGLWVRIRWYGDVSTTVGLLSHSGPKF